MDSTLLTTTMPSMDIFAKMAKSTPPSSSLLRRQQVTPERDLDDEDFDFDFDSDDDYFSQTYAPLSCLPTPPTSCYAASPFTQALESAFVNEEASSLIGSSIHLSNLVPPSCSLLAPSPTIVQGLLSRANLPAPTLAFAVVILDSLTCRFASTWRKQLPLSSPQSAKQASLTCNNNTTTLSSPPPKQEQHIDIVRPEVIIASSLLIAQKFLDDTGVRTSTFAREFGQGMWSCEMINKTEIIIMENLGWRIGCLLDEGLLQEAQEDMIRAGLRAKRRASKKMGKPIGLENKNGQAKKEENQNGTGNGRKRASQGSEWSMGQLTPLESPIAKGRRVD